MPYMELRSGNFGVHPLASSFCLGPRMKKAHGAEPKLTHKDLPSERNKLPWL